MANGAGGADPLTSLAGVAKQGLKEQAAGVAGVASGLAGIAGSLVGGRARRREQRQAEKELKLRKSEYDAFEFQDPTKNMTNPFEDLTVNQQQAQFQSQQQQQALAGTLSGLQGAAGGGGIAALAQTLAQQSSANLQQTSASIGQQEAANQMARAKGQANLEVQRAEGAKYVQDATFGKMETQLDMAAQRKQAADEARAKATQDLVGGIGKVVGGVATAAVGGLDPLSLMPKSE